MHQDNQKTTRENLPVNKLCRFGAGSEIETSQSFDKLFSLSFATYQRTCTSSHFTSCQDRGFKMAALLQANNLSAEVCETLRTDQTFVHRWGKNKPCTMQAYRKYALECIRFAANELIC